MNNCYSTNYNTLKAIESGKEAIFVLLFDPIENEQFKLSHFE